MADFTKTIGLKKPIKLAQLPVLDVNNPEVNMLVAMRNAGKGVLKEKFVEKFWKAHITTFEGWAARDGENAYYALVKNCKKKWEFTVKFMNHFVAHYHKIYEMLAEEKQIDFKKGYVQNMLQIFRYYRYKNPKMETREIMKEIMDMPNNEMFDYYINTFIDEEYIVYDKETGTIQLDEEGLLVGIDTPIHCKCEKGYPITLIVPSYTQFDPELVKNSPANKQYFWDYHEFERWWSTTSEAKMGIPSPLPRDYNFWKVPLPEELQQHNLKIVTFTVPSTPARKEIFIREFKEIVITAREEHRIIVMNPMFFLGEEHKFKTLEAIINYIELLTQQEFQPKSPEDLGMPRHMWPDKYKSWEKLAIILDEMKTIAPTSRLSGQKASGFTKRSIYDKIGEIRHWNCYLVCCTQSTEDIFDRIRYQANKVIVKRISANLLGETYGWLFEQVKALRKKKFLQRGVKPEIVAKEDDDLIDPFIRYQVDLKSPRVDELPDDWAVVTTISDEFAYYHPIEPNRHHHKHTKDHFSKDFNIKWEFVDEETGERIEGLDLEKEVQEDEKEEEEKASKKDAQRREMEAVHMNVTVDHMTFPEIAQQQIGAKNWDDLDKKQQKNAADKIRHRYNRYLEKLNKELK